MNKKYIVPQIRVISFVYEGLVAGSDKIGFTASHATHGNPDGDVLSNRRGGSIWDED